MSKRIVIAGAGLTGSLLSIFLAKRGYTVDVYERRPDMRKTSISAGKSINLAISARGLHALEMVGLDKEVLKNAVPMKGRMMHSEKGELSFQPYGKNDNEYINSISRKELNIMLMNAAEKFPEVKFHFNQRCVGMNMENKRVFFVDERTAESSFTDAETVIGTDGSASALRMEFLKSGFFNYSQTYQNYGYKELNIPALPGHQFRMEKNALHIWPRGSYMMIALPNVEGDFTCTLFMNHQEGDRNFSRLTNKQEVENFFQEVMPDALPMMPDLLEDFFENPTGNLLTIKCFPWNLGGKALLMGDAAHAIVPFFGQGMNCCFEDCYFFDTLLEKYCDNWEEIFTAFTAIRKENTDAIADMAIENFVEMRDLVANKTFLLKRKADVLLEERYPEQFISKYAMVSFHRIPYAVAMKRGQLQDKILMEICSGINSIEELNVEKAFQQIMEAFAQAGISSSITHTV